MSASAEAHLSVASLDDAPMPPLAETVKRARRLVSSRVGIIAEARFQEMSADDPAVSLVACRLANVPVLIDQPAPTNGGGAAVNPERAIAKAVGESVERYCCALHDPDRLRVATYRDLGDEAIDPSLFALFSQQQYAQPGFPFRPFGPRTSLGWVRGRSLVKDRPTYVPAAYVFVPYRHDPRAEAVIRAPISTGVASGPTLASATYRALVEVIERDAFMIVWNNTLSRPHIDLPSVDDDEVQRLLGALDGVPASCHAIVLTLDIPVTVILILLVGQSDHSPFAVAAMGADLSPRRALALALEEGCLSWHMATRRAALHSTYRPETDSRDIDSLERHGLAHAVAPELRSTLTFLTTPSTVVRLNELPGAGSDRPLTNLKTVVQAIEAKGLDAVAVDLTTSDIDDAGFKVVRVVVPQLQPLDVDHNYRHLGGRRLYEVPLRLGLVERSLREDELNTAPHPFA